MDNGIDFKEIQRDISEYVSKKYGLKFKIAGFGPEPDRDKESGGDTGKAPEDAISSIQFDMKPGELKAYLDEYLVRQEEAKQVLATKICTHFNRIKRFELSRKHKRTDPIGDIKNNIIMIGPTGVGKTFLIKLIANKIGVPFVKGDATKFSETGYVGGDVEDLVRDLVQEANGNIELAQYGIIYLDEVDKLASSRGIFGPDVSRTGVQRALLKPLEETDVELKVPHDPIAQMEALQEYQRTGKREKKKISTKHILFIMSGAFNGLEEIVNKRRHQKGIGFEAQMPVKETAAAHLQYLKAEDLIQYGFESEFIGRLPVVTVFEHLETEDLYKILCNPKSPIVNGKKRDFNAYGIDLQFDETALRKIAENACRERTGARGLVSAMERVLIKFEHTLPSTDIRHLLVTGDTVDDPARALEEMLSYPDDPEREKAYQAFVEEEARCLETEIRTNVPAWQKKYNIQLPEERIRFISRHGLERLMDAEAMIDEIQRLQRIVQDYAAEFSARNDLELTFTGDAIDCLLEITWKTGQTPADFLKQSFQNYDHGFKLIKEKTGSRQFVISEAGMKNPDEYLNKLIQEAYRLP